MFGRIKHTVMMFMLLFALASCDKTIHEYPGANNIELTVRCSVDMAHPEHFVTVECDAENGTSYVVRTQSVGTLGTRFTEPVCLRYVVDLYRIAASHSTFVERKVCFSPVDAANPCGIFCIKSGSIIATSGISCGSTHTIFLVLLSSVIT